MPSNSAPGMQGNDRNEKGTTFSRAVKMRDESGLQPLRVLPAGGPSLRPASRFFAFFAKRKDSGTAVASLA
jgi:hypothetical protein